MVGPEIPEHLLAASRPSNPENDISEHGGGPSGIGPGIPAHLLGESASARSTTPDGQPELEVGHHTHPLGPALPSIPTVGSKRSGVTPQIQPEEEEEEEEDYAPALPPDLLAARAAGSASTAATGKASIKRTIGPTLPPHLAGRNAGYDEDDDDDYGPAPPPSGTTAQEKSGVEEFIEREERRKKQLEEANKPKALKREEWMLVPPSQSDLLGSIDPTRIKRPRKFAPSAQTGRDADTSLWTETPAERQQRIADEVAGKRRRVTDVHAVSPEEEREMRKRRRYEEEVRRGVDEHTRKVRGATLVDQHTRASGAEDKDKDEEPPAIWDHGRDMALGGKLLDDKSREKFIREARGLGDRFGSGKSGGFL